MPPVLLVRHVIGPYPPGTLLSDFSRKVLQRGWLRRGIAVMYLE